MPTRFFIRFGEKIGRRRLVFGFVGVGGGEAGGFAEWIDKVGDEIFFFGAAFEDFFFVFDDDFIIVHFDDFFTRNGELWVDEGLESGASNNDLLNHKIFAGDGIIRNFAKFGTFFGFDFEVNEFEIECKNFADSNDIFGADEIVDTVYN